MILKNKNISVIDLFCGIGGLSYGLSQSGIPVKLGIDIDSSCKYAFETNCKSKFIERDVSEEFKKLTTSDTSNNKYRLKDRVEFVRDQLLGKK